MVEVPAARNSVPPSDLIPRMEPKRRPMQRETAPTNSGPQPYPAEKARGGEIILRTPQRRIVFIAGLAGAVLLAVLLGIFSWR